MTTKIKERPILMHARSINGILAGRKTQTRRIVTKLSPDFDFVGPDNSDPPQLWAWRGEQGEGAEPWFRMPKCPYGKPGDRLWVRETFFDHGPDFDPRIEYRATPWHRDDQDGAGGWKPSIHMPRWACRLVLEVVSVRVERVQDISVEDIAAEGCIVMATVPGKPVGPLSREAIQNVCDAASRKVWADLWEDTNGKGAWERNDWVWVVEFKVATNV